MRCIHKGAGYILFLQLFHYFDQDNLIDCQIILEAMNFSQPDYCCSSKYDRMSYQIWAKSNNLVGVRLPTEDILYFLNIVVI